MKKKIWFVLICLFVVFFFVLYLWITENVELKFIKYKWIGNIFIEWKLLYIPWLT